GELLDNAKKLSDYQIKNEGYIHVAISDNHGAQSRGDWKAMIEALPENCGADGFYSDEQLARMLQESERGEQEREDGNESVEDLERDWRINDHGFDNPYPQTHHHSGDDVRTDTQDFVCGFFLGMLLGIWVFLLIMCNRQYARSARFRYGAMLGAIVNLIGETLSSSSSPRSDSNQTGSDKTSAT
ncbi:hypothetical protein RFI_07015, partial [Reticulomyxa filosa]